MAYMFLSFITFVCFVITMVWSSKFNLSWQIKEKGGSCAFDDNSTHKTTSEAKSQHEHRM